MMSRLYKGLPLSVWALSLSTYFLNLSSTIVFTIMPLFLRSYFKISCSQTGALEGIAEGIALVTRAVVGMASDLSKKRKSFLVVGYFVSLLSRILLAVCSVFSGVVASRVLDKIGNGIQASPREAYISDVTPRPLLGKAYGMNKALGMMGSLSASLFLMVVFSCTGISVRILLWIAAVLTGFSVLCLMAGVRDASHPCVDVETSSGSFRQKIKKVYKELKLFPSSYWMSIFIVFLFKLGYFSGTYLILLLDIQGFENFFGLQLKGKFGLAASVVMIIQNGFCALFSYPMGALSDRIDRRYVVAIGIICMLIALLCFGLGAHNPWVMLSGLLFYGIQMSMQGALMALLSLTMPKELRGTGFGLFFLISGIGVIVANQLFMKQLWDSFSAQTAFLSITLPILLALCLLPFIPLKKSKETF
jgi:MFS family permease